MLFIENSTNKKIFYIFNCGYTDKVFTNIHERILLSRAIISNFCIDDIHNLLIIRISVITLHLYW